MNSIESYKLLEHFDYMTKYIPQPFYINSGSVKEFKKVADDYVIVTDKNTYSMNQSSLKKLVDSLGIKVKLFTNDNNEETCVIEQIMPAINKLFKCFADCFVFYADNEDHLRIIDLNVNMTKGDEGTKFENGPSPWTVDIVNNPSTFTCFSQFIENYELDDPDVCVKADDIMSSSTNVLISLFKEINEPVLQPMLMFSSKFSNMFGFSEIHPALFDKETGVNIVFPMNYVTTDLSTFKSMWEKVLHILHSTDLNDFISREVSELEVSKETPNSVKKIISSLREESSININQPISLILNEANNMSSNMKPGKAKKFKKQLGILIGWCLCMKHSSCNSCGHLELK